MTPVVPKPASTVVLINAEKTKIYMTKRPETMKSFSGYFVFPGGTVCPEDYEKEADRRLLNMNPDHSLPPAYYVAAARELMEEVGIFLGCEKDGKPILMDPNTLEEYRRRLLTDEISFFDILKGEGLYLDLDNLTYFARLVTPERNPFRFDTRFFLAQLPEGQSPDPFQDEIDEALWMEPGQALSAWENDLMLMAPPTVLTIEMIGSYLNGSPLRFLGEEELREKLAKYRNKKSS